MSSNTTPLNITVAHRGTTHELSLHPDCTLEELQIQLEELTEVPPSLQKLLYKGKKPLSASAGEVTVSQAGLRNGIKVQMLGSTLRELGDLQAVETYEQKRNHILRERALKAPTKIRSTGSSNGSALNYRFHQLTPLSHLPNPAGALALLTKLADDPAIKHVMQKHQFSVGVLTELAPHEHPGLLGLNVNAGQAIKLRLRTDRYDGFRLYAEVRRVLCHELTHNVWGDHDNNFKELNSKLNREVAEFERSAAEGTHHLSEKHDVYEPTSELETGAQVHVLGGGPAGSRTMIEESREALRHRILEAAMARLRKEEEELENSCGT
ncbi:WLM-domain-containing protein, partial [Collybia nuda]